MRIALISDLHGNLISLDAVLDDIHREQVDQIVCLGDVATLGPHPREVIDRLGALHCPCIMGNHESDLLDLAAFQHRQDVPRFIIDTVSWCASQLTEQHLAFLRAFLPSLEIQMDANTSLLCFHGSPRANTDLILATTAPDELDMMLSGYSAELMAGGHSHVQMLRRHKGILIVNPGSVGEPIEVMPFADMPRILPWAEYAIVSADAGRISVDLRRVPISVDAVRQAAMSSTNPLNWATYWLEQNRASHFTKR